VHDNELIRQFIGEREWIAFLARADGGAIRPIVNNSDLSFVGSLFLYEALPHGFTDGHNAISLLNEEAADPIQQFIQGTALKTLEKPGDLWKDILTDKDERRPIPSGGEKSGKADNRGIRERYDYISTPDIQSGEAT
jgi:hypothetical protein